MKKILVVACIVALSIMAGCVLVAANNAVTDTHPAKWARKQGQLTFTPYDRIPEREMRDLRVVRSENRAFVMFGSKDEASFAWPDMDQNQVPEGEYLGYPGNGVFVLESRGERVFTAPELPAQIRNLVSEMGPVLVYVVDSDEPQQ